MGRTGEWDTEGHDLPDIRLPGNQDALVTRVLEANPNTVVVLQTGGPVEMPWIDAAPAILQAWYGGQETGNAIADILFGASEPGGRLAQTFPVRHEDAPAMSGDPVVYPGADGKVEYREGTFIGYRHYDKSGIAPLFPFGFGLGYTQFDLSDASVVQDDLASGGTATVAVKVTNIGAREGQVVVQLYVGGAAGHREKELKAFAKLSLKPGKNAEAKLVLSPRDFAHFDVAGRCWRIAAGQYDIRVGQSSADLGKPMSVTFSEAMTLAV